MPKRASPTSVRPAPTSPAKPTTSPARTSKFTSSNVNERLSPVDPQHRFARYVAGAHEEVVDVPADHLTDKQLVARLGGEPGGDVPAVAEHGDPIGDAEHLVETVADEQHGDAPVAQPAHLVEQAVDLVGRQRRRRLVHDQHPGVEGDRLGDLHRLLCRDRERVGRGTGIDVDVEGPQDGVRFLVHPPPPHDLIHDCGGR